MRRLAILAVLMVFFSSFVSAAAWVKDTKEDRIMVRGIRPMGMGGAFVAVSDDENAIFYNPAGIASRQSWLLQIVTIGGAVNSETIKLAKDAFDIVKDSKDDSNGSSGGMSLDDLQEIKDIINNKDVDFSLLLPINLFFISGPIEFGNNNLNFGIGEYVYTDVGINMDMHVPQYLFDVAKLGENDGAPDLDTIFKMFPVDTVLTKLTGLTSSQIADYMNGVGGTGGDGDLAALLAVIDEYGNHDVADLINDIKEGKEINFEEVMDAIESAGILDDVGATALINVYATGIIDIPVAYKIKSLEAVHLPGALSIGANFKYIQRIKAARLVGLNASNIGNLEDGLDSINLGVIRGQGFGIDLGTIYHFNPQFNLGLQVADVYTKIDYDNVVKKYPKDADDSEFTHTATIEPEVNVGVSFVPEKFYFWKGKYISTKNRFTFAADVRDLTGNYETDFQDKLHLGAEYRFSPIALRVGLNKLTPSFGLGFEFSGFQVMYAFYGDKSYLAKAMGIDKTIYYHEVLISVKLGHYDGKPFGSDVKNPKEKLTKEEKKAKKEKIKAAKAAAKGKSGLEKEEVQEQQIVQNKEVAKPKIKSKKQKIVDAMVQAKEAVEINIYN